MKASLSTVRLESLNQTQVSYEANSMFDDLMSKAKSLACFLDTATTSERAGGIKYNQEERAGGIKYNQEERAGALFHFYMII